MFKTLPNSNENSSTAVEEITMRDKGIMTGTITDEETGEESFLQFYPLFLGLKLTTVVRIFHVDSYVHPDGSMQVSVDCEALDSVGMVYKANMDFTPDSESERDTLLEDMKVDAVFMVEGSYGIMLEEKSVGFNNPSYGPVNPGILDEIRRAFSFNAKMWKAN